MTQQTERGGCGSSSTASNHGARRNEDPVQHVVSRRDTRVEKPVRNRWFLRALLVAIIYSVVGVALGALAGNAASSQMRFIWRLAAWTVSGVTFAAHVWYERVRLRNVPRVTALYASLATALGAFLLAVSANVHGVSVGSNLQPLLLIALVAWPVITALPAFVVALVLAVLFARWGRSE